MKRILSILFALFTLVLAAETQSAIDQTPKVYPPSLDSVALRVLDTAFTFSNLTERDAGFEKKCSSDTLFLLPLVERFLDCPFEMPDTLDSWSAQLREKMSAAEIVKACYAKINVASGKDDSKKIVARLEKLAALDTTGTVLNGRTRQALRLILAGMDEAKQKFAQSRETVNDARLDSLLYLLPTFFTDEEDTLDDTLRCYFLNLLGHACDTSLDIKLDSLYLLMHEIKLDKMAEGSYILACALDAAAQILRDSTAIFPVSALEFQARHGKIIIGTKGTDVFGDAEIIIDGGGNDVYRGEHARGCIGKRAFGVVIDLAGNDFYDSREGVCAQAVGVLGAGFLLDCSGDDFYMATHYAQGAGLFGCGVLIDENGDDSYSGGVFVQGAACFGVGAIVDHDGEDAYRSYASAQAFAGPQGFGLSCDNDGDDLYYSGGKYSHAPLKPFDYHSFAQGFAIGWRPDVSGGIGFLFDGGGNDSYNCGVYGQGTGYWYAFGALVDDGGNDVHTSVYYPQGAGIHLAAGALVDRGGDDVYVSRNGPGQGAAHDYSVGFFSEWTGDDTYVIDGGNGCALTNSFALFIDRNGNDVYAKRNPKSASNFGYATGARSTGSMGFFIDIQGDDYYNDANVVQNGFWFNGDIGFGLDIDGVKFPDPVAELGKKLAEEMDKDTIRTIEKIFADACEWGVGSGQAKADKAFAELLDSANAAAAYICEKQLGTKSSLGMRTVENFTKKKKELMRSCMFEALHSEDVLRRGNSVYLFGEMAETLAVDSLLPLLKNRRTRLGAISALGKIRDKRATTPIAEHAKDDRQAIRYTVAKSLASLADSTALHVLFDYLSDDYVTVRLAAAYGIVGMRKWSFDTALTTLPKLEHTAQIHLLDCISDMCSAIRKDTTLSKPIIEQRIAQARGIVLPLLTSPNAPTRVHVLRALSNIGGDETKTELRRRYELETDRFVRVEYERIFSKP